MIRLSESGKNLHMGPIEAAIAAVYSPPESKTAKSLAQQAQAKLIAGIVLTRTAPDGIDMSIEKAEEVRFGPFSLPKGQHKQLRTAFEAATAARDPHTDHIEGMYLHPDPVQVVVVAQLALNQLQGLQIGKAK